MFDFFAICVIMHTEGDFMAPVIKKGKIVKGIVTGIENYGIFVSLDSEYTGLIHISEISNGYVKDINEVAKIGDTISSEIIDIDEDTKRTKLSIKNMPSKINTRKNSHKIIETSLGFKTLAYKLPIWIEESLKKQKNV